MQNNQTSKNQIVFACLSPHPPIILPTVGSEKDREKVKKTIESLELLGRKLKKINPDKIIISAPHRDWGFNVPLYFLAKELKTEIEQYLIGLESPSYYFEKGKRISQSINQRVNNQKVALIASGDMSHCLKEEGPYGFHPDGPQFDKEFIESLQKREIEKILKLDDLYPQAGECGLRSFCFLLGILEGSKIDWQAKILSYEGPFGVGYLVVEFILTS